MSLYSSLTQVLASFAAKINGLLTGWDGTRYSTPGEAVRQQIADLHVLIGDEPGTAIQASAVAYNDSNVAAELTNVNGRLDDLSNDIAVVNGVDNVQYDIGEIDTATGENLTSRYRIRSSFISVIDTTNVIVDNLHRVLWVGYDDNKSYVSAKNSFFAAGESFSFKAVIASNPSVKYVRLLYKRSDDSAISDSDISAIKTFLHREARIDKAEAKILGIQEALSALPKFQKAKILQMLNKTNTDSGYIATNGLFGASSNWRLHYFNVGGKSNVDITTTLSAIAASAATKYPYAFYNIEVTPSNIGSITKENVLLLSAGTGGADVGKASAAGAYTYEGVKVPDGAETLVICSGSAQAYIDSVACGSNICDADLYGSMYAYRDIYLTGGEYTVTVPATDDTRNLIISANTYNDGDELPTLRAKQNLYNSPIYTVGDARRNRNNQWRLPPMIAETATLITIVVPNGTTLHVKEFSIEFSDFTKKTSGLILCGHNGFYGMCPKDTMPSFEMAAKLGYPICITIPKVTMDNVIVCIHNDTINATARDSSGVQPTDPLYVSNMTYDELLQWDFGRYKKTYWAGTKIPTVEEFFALCAVTGMEPMFSTHPDLTVSNWQLVKEMLIKYGIIDKFHMKSFNASALTTAFSVFGDAIASYTLDVNGDVNYLSAISNMENTGIQGNVKQVIEYDENVITEEYVTATLNAGFACAVWNVFDISGERYKELIRMGVTIFTDDFNCCNGLAF